MYEATTTDGTEEDEDSSWARLRTGLGFWERQSQEYVAPAKEQGGEGTASEGGEADEADRGEALKAAQADARAVGCV